jgi:hypothetical protein
MELLGIFGVDFDVIDQLLRYSIFVGCWRRNGNIMGHKVCGSVRTEILHSILIEFGIHMNPIMLIEMCLNETYSKVRIGKNLSDAFPIQNGLK